MGKIYNMCDIFSHIVPSDRLLRGKNCKNDAKYGVFIDNFVNLINKIAKNDKY